VRFAKLVVAPTLLCLPARTHSACPAASRPHHRPSHLRARRCQPDSAAQCPDALLATTPHHRHRPLSWPPTVPAHGARSRYPLSSCGTSAQSRHRRPPARPRAHPRARSDRRRVGCSRSAECWEVSEGRCRLAPFLCPSPPILPPPPVTVRCFFPCAPLRAWRSLPLNAAFLFGPLPAALRVQGLSCGLYDCIVWGGARCGCRSAACGDSWPRARALRQGLEGLSMRLLEFPTLDPVASLPPSFL